MSSKGFATAVDDLRGASGILTGGAPSGSDPEAWHRRLARVPGLAGASVALAEVLALLWLEVRPARMNRGVLDLEVAPATAVCMALAGVALLLLTGGGRRWRRRLGHGVSIVIAALAAAALVASMAGLPILGGTGALFRQTPSSPDTAAALTCVGLALLLLDVDRRGGYRPAMVAARIVGGLSLASVLATLYGSPRAHGLSGAFRMPMATAAPLMLLSLGILAARTDRPVMRILLGSGPGGVLGRRLLPAEVLVPVLSAALWWAGAHGGWYQPGWGPVLSTMVTMLILVLLISLTVRTLDRVHGARQAALDALIEAEERFQAAFDNAPIGMTLTDADGRWLAVNPAMCALTGYSKAQLLTKTFQDLTHPDDREADHEGLRRMLAGLSDTYRAEKRYLRADGSQVWVKLLVSVIRDSHGGFRHFVAQMEDITESRAHEAELAGFAAVVAHDLKIPLTAVTGHAEVAQDLLLQPPEPPQAALTSLARVVSGAERMRVFIDDLLAYTTARDGTLNLRPVPLRSVVDDVVGLHLDQARFEQRPLPTIRVGQLPVVHADPVLLRQLIDNLIGNAIKYTAAGDVPDVEITATPSEPDRIRVVVADRGIGIPAGQHQAVFNPFHRAHRDAGRSGSGVGLAICQRVVERHGGSICAVDNPRGGTRICFTLPCPSTSGS